MAGSKIKVEVDTKGIAESIAKTVATAVEKGIKTGTKDAGKEINKAAKNLEKAGKAVASSVKSASKDAGGGSAAGVSFRSPPSSAFNDDKSKKAYDAALKRAADSLDKITKLREEAATKEKEVAKGGVVGKNAKKSLADIAAKMKSAGDEVKNSLKFASKQLNSGAADVKKSLDSFAQSLTKISAGVAQASVVGELEAVTHSAQILRGKLDETIRDLRVLKGATALSKKEQLPSNIHVSSGATGGVSYAAKKLNGETRAVIAKLSNTLSSEKGGTNTELVSLVKVLEKKLSHLETVLSKKYEPNTKFLDELVRRLAAAAPKSGGKTGGPERKTEVREAYRLGGVVLSKDQSRKRNIEEEKRYAAEQNKAVGGVVKAPVSAVDKSSALKRAAAGAADPQKIYLKYFTEEQQKALRERELEAKRQRSRASRASKTALGYEEKAAVATTPEQKAKFEASAGKYRQKQAEAEKAAKEAKEQRAKLKAGYVKEAAAHEKVITVVNEEAKVEKEVVADTKKKASKAKKAAVAIDGATKEAQKVKQAEVKAAKEAAQKAEAEKKATAAAEALVAKEAEAAKKAAQKVEAEKKAIAAAEAGAAKEAETAKEVAKKAKAEKKAAAVAEAAAIKKAGTAKKAAQKVTSEKKVITATEGAANVPKLPRFSKYAHKERELLGGEVAVLVGRAVEQSTEAQKEADKGNTGRAAKLKEAANRDLAQAKVLAKARYEFTTEATAIWNKTLKLLGNTAASDEAALRLARELVKRQRKAMQGKKISPAGISTENIVATVKGAGGNYSEANIKSVLAALLVHSGSGGGGVAGGGGTGGGEPPSGGAGGGEPPIQKWRTDIDSLIASFSKFFNNLSSIDIETITKAPLYRNLAARHASEYFKSYPHGLPTAEHMRMVYGDLSKASSTPGRVGALNEHVQKLLQMAETPSTSHAKSLGPTLSSIRELTSAKAGSISLGTEDQKKLMSETQRAVLGALKKLISSVAETTYDIENDILKAEAAVEAARNSGDKKAIYRAKGKLQEKVREFVHTVRSLEEMYTAAETSGGATFNPNLERSAAGVLQYPRRVIPEATFRNKPRERVAAMVEGEERRKNIDLGSAKRALEIAQDFEGIADSSERTRRALASVFDELVPGSVAFRNNMTVVIEGLKRIGQNGLIDPADVDRLVGVFQRYEKEIQEYSMLGKGIPGGKGVVRIPLAFEGVKGGGVEKEFLRQIERTKERIAREGKVGERIPIMFELPDKAGGMRRIMVEFRKMGNTVDAVRHKVQNLSKVMGTRELFSTALRRVAMWGTAAGLTYGAISAFRSAIDVMVSAESGVVSLAKVMGEADINFKKFSSDVINFASNTARKYAASLKDIFGTLKIFGQQGLSLDKAKKLTESVLLATNISDLNQQGAAEALTATIKQFDLEYSHSMRIIDAWNEVSNNNAVSMKTLADATKKAGAAAHVVGLQLEQFLGIVTAIGEATRQPGKEVGTSLRFIFQRSMRPDSSKQLATVGIRTKDLEGNFKGFSTILTELADKWDTLGNSQQIAIAQAMGGARQYNAFIALMNNYDTAIKATTEALNSQGSAHRENSKYMQSTAARMKKAQAAVHGLYVNIGSSLLPVIKALTDATGSLASFLSKIPSGVKVASVAMLGLSAVVSRLAMNFDYVIGMGGAGKGAGVGALFASLGGGLIGAAKSPEQLGEVAKRAALTAPARTGKGISDLGGSFGGLLGVGALTTLEKEGAALKKLQIIPVKGAKGWALTNKYVNGNIRSMSKLNAVVKGYGVQVAGATEASKLGISSLNSPLLMLVALFAKMGKGVLSMGVGVVATGAKLVTFFSSTTRAAIATGEAFIKTKLAGLGLITSLAATAAIGYGIYKLAKFMGLFGKETKKTRKELEASLAPELQKRSDALHLVVKEVAALEQLSAREKKLARLRARTGVKTRVDEIRQGTYRSPVVAAVANERLQAQAGGVIAQANPAAIESMDKYGRVVLNTSKSMLELARAEIDAKAALLAFTKTKLAIRSAEQANAAFKKLSVTTAKFKKVVPAAKVFSGYFGMSFADMKGYSSLSAELIERQSKYNEQVKILKETIRGFPKSTPLSAFARVLSNTDVMSVFAQQAQIANKALKENGLDAATAADGVNKLFLEMKGLHGVGITGGVTKENMLQKGIVSRSVKEFVTDIKKGKETLGKQQLIVFGKEGPFGLDQARVYLDASGKYIVEGINKTGTQIHKTLTEVRDSLHGEKALIFDPSRLVQQFNNSILKVKKQISGAGAGLIQFNGRLNLGVKFGFELPGMDRIQKVGQMAKNMVVSAQQAYKSYESLVSNYNKEAKEGVNAAEKIASDMQARFNDLGRIASQNIFFVSLSNEVTKLGASVEKAAYDFKRSSIADEVEGMFATISTSAKGYSPRLTMALPKLGSQLSPKEAVGATNPELVRAVRSVTKATDLVRNVAISTRTITSLDLPKMLAESGAAGVKRFFDRSDQDRKLTVEAIQKYGGSKPMAAMAIEQRGTTSAVDSMHKEVVHQLELLRTGGNEKQGTVGKPNAAADYAFLSFQRALAPVLKVEKTKKAVGNVSGPGVTLFSGESAKAVIAKAYKEGLAKSLTGNELANFIRKQYLVALEKAALHSAVSVPITPKEENPARTYFGKVAGVLGDTVGNKVQDAQKWVVRNVFRQKTYGYQYSKEDRALRDANSKLGPLLDRLQKVTLGPFRQYIASRQAGVSPVIKGNVNPANTKKEIKESDKVLAAIINAADTSFNALVSSIGKQIEAQKELITGIAVASTSARSFSSAVKKSIQHVLDLARADKALSGLSSPIVGAARGIPSLTGISLGKSTGELSTLEKLYKKFPDYVGPIVKQERIRSTLLKELPGIYSKLTKGMRTMKELSVGASPSQKDKYTRIYATSKSLFNELASTVRNANEQMSPFVESLRRMAALEEASKSIKSIVDSLLMAQDLRYNTSSVDIAMGRHPLSPTGGVYGQPADLNKFERRLFELEQKKNTGVVSSSQYDTEKARIAFDRKEALRQYTGSKEKSKLEQEVSAAQQAMQVLWRAQSKGISGLRPIINKLKSELSTAGESYISGGKKYYKGVPSLYGVQKSLAGVQKQEKALDFRQQRSIVMAGVEGLLGRVNDNIKEQSRIVAAAQKDAGGSKIISKLSALLSAFVSSHKTLREVLVTSFAALQKKFTEATVKGRGNYKGIADKTVDTLGKVAGSFNTGVSRFTNVVKNFEKAVGKLLSAADTLSTKSTGTKALPSRFMPVGGKAAGGLISGPAGVDNIPVNLASGSFVMRKKAVSKMGTSALSALSGGSGVPTMVSAGEYVFTPEQVKKIGVSNLRKLNTGGSYGIGYRTGDLVGPHRKKLTASEAAALFRKETRGIDIYGNYRPNRKWAGDFFRKVDRAVGTRTFETNAGSNASARLRAGEGKGYIRVGNRVLAIGNPAELSDSYQATNRMRVLRQAYSKGSLNRRQLRNLAYSMVPRGTHIGLDSVLPDSINKADRTFLRAMGLGVSPNRLRHMLSTEKRMIAAQEYDAKHPEEVYRRSEKRNENRDAVGGLAFQLKRNVFGSQRINDKYLAKLRKEYGRAEGRKDKSFQEQLYYTSLRNSLSGTERTNALAANISLLTRPSLASIRGKERRAAFEKQTKLLRAIARKGRKKSGLGGLFSSALDDAAFASGIDIGTGPSVQITSNGQNYKAIRIKGDDGKEYVVDSKSRGKGWTEKGEYIPGIKIPVSSLGGFDKSARSALSGRVTGTGDVSLTDVLGHRYGGVSARGMLNKKFMETLQKRYKEIPRKASWFDRMMKWHPKSTLGRAAYLLPGAALHLVAGAAGGIAHLGAGALNYSVDSVMDTIGILRGKSHNRVARRATDLYHTGKKALGQFYRNIGLWNEERPTNLRDSLLHKGKYVDRNSLYYLLQGIAARAIRGRKYLGGPTDWMTVIERGTDVGAQALAAYLSAGGSAAGSLGRVGEEVSSLGRFGRVGRTLKRFGGVFRRGSGVVGGGKEASVTKGLAGAEEASVVGGLDVSGKAYRRAFVGRTPLETADLLGVGKEGKQAIDAMSERRFFDIPGAGIRRTRKYMRKLFLGEGSNSRVPLPPDVVKKMTMDQYLSYLPGGTKLGKKWFGLGKERTVADLRLSRMFGSRQGIIKRSYQWLKYRRRLRSLAKKYGVSEEEIASVVSAPGGLSTSSTSVTSTSGAFVTDTTGAVGGAEEASVAAKRLSGKKEFSPIGSLQRKGDKFTFVPGRAGVVEKPFHEFKRVTPWSIGLPGRATTSLSPTEYFIKYGQEYSKYGLSINDLMNNRDLNAYVQTLIDHGAGNDSRLHFTVMRAVRSQLASEAASVGTGTPRLKSLSYVQRRALGKRFGQEVANGPHQPFRGPARLVDERVPEHMPAKHYRQMTLDAMMRSYARKRAERAAQSRLHSFIFNDSEYHSGSFIGTRGTHYQEYVDDAKKYLRDNTDNIARMAEMRYRALDSRGRAPIFYSKYDIKGFVDKIADEVLSGSSVARFSTPSGAASASDWLGPASNSRGTANLRVTGFAKGGVVFGPGTGTSDSILAWLSKGEYVVPADVVNRLGVGTLDKMSGVKGFASGGSVGSNSGGNAGSMFDVFSSFSTALEKVTGLLNKQASVISIYMAALDTASTRKTNTGRGGVTAIAERNASEASVGRNDVDVASLAAARRKHEKEVALAGRVANESVSSPSDYISPEVEKVVTGFQNNISSITEVVKTGFSNMFASLKTSLLPATPGKGALAIAAQTAEWKKTAPSDIIGTSGLLARRGAMQRSVSDAQTAAATAAQTAEWKKTAPSDIIGTSGLLARRGVMQRPIGEVGAKEKLAVVDKTMPGGAAAGGAAINTDNLASAISTSVSSALAESMKGLTVGLNGDDISAIQSAVKEGTAEGMTDAVTSISDAISSMGDVVGKGAAVRPAVLESLEGSMNILKERVGDIDTSISDIREQTGQMVSDAVDEIEKTKKYVDDKVGKENIARITDINRRFSEESSNIEKKILQTVKPPIDLNKETIRKNNHLIKGLDSMVHNILARLGNR